MQQTINIANKTVSVSLSAKALAQLEKRASPLVMEMELYFSCLIRKAVHFDVEANPSLSASVGEKLLLSFRPVMSNSCKIEPDKSAELTDFPIAKVSPYIPRWVSLDYQHGQWRGDFGYA